MDQVGPQPGQRVVGMPLPPSDIGDQHAAVGDQPLHQILPFGRAHVGGDRTLALVQPGPVDAVAVVGERPAVVVGGAADRVDADHLGAELGQRHPGQRHRDEAGDLDDPHPGQRPGRRRTLIRSSYQAPADRTSFDRRRLDGVLRQQHLQRGVAERDEAVLAGDAITAPVKPCSSSAASTPSPTPPVSRVSSTISTRPVALASRSMSSTGSGASHLQVDDAGADVDRVPAGGRPAGSSADRCRR